MEIEKEAAEEGGTIVEIMPIFDYVVVTPHIQDRMSKGGILIPDSATEKKREVEAGFVMAAGPGARLPSGEIAPMSVKEGDNILYRTASAQLFSDGNVEYLMMREATVMAIVTAYDAEPSNGTTKGEA